MTRKTSIDAYKDAVASGLLSKRRQEVLKVIAYRGPMGQVEVVEELNRDSSCITPRFAELKRMDVIQEVGFKNCPFTGRRVIAWNITGRKVKRYEKRFTNSARLDIARAALGMVIRSDDSDLSGVARRALEKINYRE